MEGTERQQEETLRSVGQWNGIWKMRECQSQKQKHFCHLRNAKKKENLCKKIFAKWRRPPANHLANDATSMYLRSCLYQLEKFFFLSVVVNAICFLHAWFGFLVTTKKWEFVSCIIIIQRHLELKGKILSKLNKTTTNAFDFPYMQIINVAAPACLLEAR